MNQQTQIVKEFIQDSFIPIEEIVANHNESPFDFAVSIVEQIADVQGDAVDVDDVHAALAEFGADRYNLRKVTGGQLLTRLSDSKEVFFQGDDELYIEAEWDNATDVNVIGDLYSEVFE